MLALSRKKGEALMINNDIEITILEIKGEQVKIGISAPKEVPVYRKEVYIQIQEANKAASDIAGVEQLANLLKKYKYRLPCFAKNVYSFYKHFFFPDRYRLQKEFLIPLYT